MKKFRRGHIVTRSHTTAIDAAIGVIEMLKSQDEVTKISLGEIRPGASPGGRFRIKCFLIQGGIKARVRGNISVQTLYIYSKDPEKTFETLMSLNG